MASRTKFYTQNSLVESSTISDLVGTATGEERIIDYRKQSIMKVTAVSGGAYAFKIDVSATKMNPFYYGFINHNFSNGTLDVKIKSSTVDDGSDFTTGGETLTLSSATASDNLLFVNSEYGHTRRYFKIELSSTASTANYLGQFFMLTETDAYATTRDPSPIQQIAMNREGQVYNESHGGQAFVVSRYGRRRIWRLKWETITDADLLILQNFEDAVGGKEKPFIFTLDNGSTYLYGRFASDLTYSVGVSSDLNDVEFLIKEEV
jgi:hypothetical protein